MVLLKMDGMKYGVIKNGDGGGARDTFFVYLTCGWLTALAMEASWKGQCCGQEQVVCFSFAEASGRKRLAL